MKCNRQCETIGVTDSWQIWHKVRCDNWQLPLSYGLNETIFQIQCSFIVFASKWNHINYMYNPYISIMYMSINS